MRKKAFAILMSIMMMVTFMPTMAFAGPADDKNYDDVNQDYNACMFYGYDADNQIYTFDKVLVDTMKGLDDLREIEVGGFDLAQYGSALNLVLATAEMFTTGYIYDLNLDQANISDFSDFVKYLRKCKVVGKVTKMPTSGSEGTLKLYCMNTNQVSGKDIVSGEQCENTMEVSIPSYYGKLWDMASTTIMDVVSKLGSTAVIKVVAHKEIEFDAYLAKLVQQGNMTQTDADAAYAVLKDYVCTVNVPFVDGKYANIFNYTVNTTAKDSNGNNTYPLTWGFENLASNLEKVSADTSAIANCVAETAFVGANAIDEATFLNFNRRYSDDEDYKGIRETTFFVTHSQPTTDYDCSKKEFTCTHSNCKKAVSTECMLYHNDLSKTSVHSSKDVFACNACKKMWYAGSDYNDCVKFQNEVTSTDADWSKMTTTVAGKEYLNPGYILVQKYHTYGTGEFGASEYDNYGLTDDSRKISDRKVSDHTPWSEGEVEVQEEKFYKYTDTAVEKDIDGKYYKYYIFTCADCLKQVAVKGEEVAAPVACKHENVENFTLVYDLDEGSPVAKLYSGEMEMEYTVCKDCGARIYKGMHATAEQTQLDKLMTEVITQVIEIFTCTHRNLETVQVAGTCTTKPYVEVYCKNCGVREFVINDSSKDTLYFDAESSAMNLTINLKDMDSVAAYMREIIEQFRNDRVSAVMSVLVDWFTSHTVTSSKESKLFSTTATGNVAVASSVGLPTGHTPGELETIKEATCANNKVTGYKCTTCGQTLMHGRWQPTEEYGTATAHNYTVSKTIQPSHTRSLTYKTCANCGAVDLTSLVVTKKSCQNKEWDCWKTVKKATYTSEGKAYRACSDCGYSVKDIEDCQTVIADIISTANALLGTKGANITYGELATAVNKVVEIFAEEMPNEEVVTTLVNLLNQHSADLTKVVPQLLTDLNDLQNFLGHKALNGTKVLDVKTLKQAKVKSLKAGKKQFKLTWKKVTGATKYQVAYKRAGKTTYNYVFTTNTSKTIKNLAKGKKYRVKVRAIAQKGDAGIRNDGLFSPVKVVKVK